MEWFSKIPSNIKLFDLIALVFIAQYSYNIEREVTIDIMVTDHVVGVDDVP